MGDERSVFWGAAAAQAQARLFLNSQKSSLGTNNQNCFPAN
jgi:hypothetical protein